MAALRGTAMHPATMMNDGDLPPSYDKADVFGSRNNFWVRYDKLADKHDGDMLQRMNSNLDTLLIFAGLFSAVTVSFVLQTVGSISSDENYDHNVVRQHCAFLASLCSSLLAAMGAVVAKQWLVNYERTGQTGSLQAQSLNRTEKFLGVQAWSLESVVETLPSILLISFGLFFWGLLDYILSLNIYAGIVVMVLLGLSAVPWAMSVIAAAVDPRCPFKTSISSSCREIFLALIATTRWFLKITVGPALLCMRGSAGTNPTFAGLGLAKDNTDLREAERKDLLCAHSAALMLELATEDEDLISLAENIPTLTRRESVRIISQDATFTLLIGQYAKSLFRLSREGTRALKPAIVLGRAVGHVFAADPEESFEVIWDAISGMACPEGDCYSEAAILLNTILALCRKTQQEQFRRTSSSGKMHGTARAEAEDNISLPEGVAISPATAVSLAPLLALSALPLPFLQLVDQNYSTANIDSVLFSLASIALCQSLQSDSPRASIKDLADDVWATASGNNVTQEMVQAVSVHNRHLAAQQDDRLIEFHTSLLQRFRDRSERAEDNTTFTPGLEVPQNRSTKAMLSLRIGDDPTDEGIRNEEEIIVKSLAHITTQMENELDSPRRVTLEKYALQLCLSLDCRTLNGLEANRPWYNHDELGPAVARSMLSFNFAGILSNRDLPSFLRVLAKALLVIKEEEVPNLLNSSSITFPMVFAFQESPALAGLALALLDELGTNETWRWPLKEDLNLAVLRSLDDMLLGSTKGLPSHKHLLRWLVRAAESHPGNFEQQSTEKLFLDSISHVKDWIDRQSSDTIHGGTSLDSEAETLILIGSLYIGPITHSGQGWTVSDRDAFQMKKDMASTIANYIGTFLSLLSTRHSADEYLQVMVILAFKFVARAFVGSTNAEIAYEANLDRASEALAKSIPTLVQNSERFKVFIEDAREKYHRADRIQTSPWIDNVIVGGPSSREVVDSGAEAGQMSA